MVTMNTMAIAASVNNWANDKLFCRFFLFTRTPLNYLYLGILICHIAGISQ